MIGSSLFLYKCGICVKWLLFFSCGSTNVTNCKYKCYASTILMLLDYIDLTKTPIFCENKFTLAYFYKLLM